jgi:hypothetical protein
VGIVFNHEFLTGWHVDGCAPRTFGVGHCFDKSLALPPDKPDTRDVITDFPLFNVATRLAIRSEHHLVASCLPPPSMSSDVPTDLPYGVFSSYLPWEGRPSVG